MMEYTFSSKVAGLQGSAIREILKFTSVPGVISFAAGNPAPEAFPVETIRRLTNDILREEPVTMLQYGISEGYTPLRDLLKERLEKQGIYCPERDELIITAGAQQVMELACKALCNPGDTVLCEAPSFIGSLNAFKSYNVNLVGVPMDDEGMRPDALEAALKENGGAKLLYLIPNFQNPTGRTTSLARREALYKLCTEYGVIIIEDNPYGDLRFAGEEVPSLKQRDTEGQVIYAGSFSKILSPGIRVGYTAAPREIIAKMVVCKQVSDVHTNNYGQMLAYRFMKEPGFEGELSRLKDLYRQKATRMMNGIRREFSSAVHFTTPQGGLFLWCTLPGGSDMPGFCRRAVEEYKVAVVPGNAFLVSEAETTTAFRLNYSTPTNDEIDEGVHRLGGLTKEMFGE